MILKSLLHILHLPAVDLDIPACTATKIPNLNLILIVKEHKKVKDMGKGCKEQYGKSIRNKYRMRAMKTKIKKL
jgi:hypothetical protein